MLVYGRKMLAFLKMLGHLYMQQGGFRVLGIGLLTSYVVK